ncbi:glycoside hydrolase family 1 protein [Paenibacillus eucommiae]|uniref:beta-glucosidase n=1 Tax=Paenibacillus eucommiae TaxID=1355755 RepID=A0ABS4J331_9BACL|nr:family 1 glycosylhydrolase [Paenibacillus eucommiae]MBP1994252.1 beta-glucosidase [Paenibacillus eucommiae]
MIRFEFPPSFLWGAASSSFQIEGAAEEGGRGPSIWDAAARDYPERFWNGHSPQTAADFYHHFVEDIKGMKELGLTSFRLSLSWSRIIPQGLGEINEAGLIFYDQVINELLAAGIEPFVDLYHWDLPQALSDNGGFKNPQIVTDFARYAEICFKRFGDRVKRWSTMNEPSVMAFASYRDGVYPPFETDMESALLAAHHMILMHYEAVRMYRSLGLTGEIGAVIAVVPVYPHTHSPNDRAAAQRQFDFVCGWWLQPMLEGSYPASVLECPEVGALMPAAFRQQLLQSFEPMDMIGLNYYSPARCAYDPAAFLQATDVRNFYAQSDYGFLTYPQGFYDILVYVKEKYNNPKVYITENGIGQDTVNQETERLLQDDERISYVREHLRELSRAIRQGCNVHGYYHWSYLDDYEATSGYRYRFGLVHVDFLTQSRAFKRSWYYYQSVITERAVD